jgi:hypothetical protein
MQARQVVAGNDLERVAEVLHGAAQAVAPDTADAVDADLDRH